VTQWRAPARGLHFPDVQPHPRAHRVSERRVAFDPNQAVEGERRKHIETALSVVGLADRMNHYPRQLSGGQEQRVAIARAIVSDPTFRSATNPRGTSTARARTKSWNSSVDW